MRFIFELRALHKPKGAYKIFHIFEAGVIGVSDVPGGGGTPIPECRQWRWRIGVAIVIMDTESSDLVVAVVLLKREQLANPSTRWYACSQLCRE